MNNRQRVAQAVFFFALIPVCAWLLGMWDHYLGIAQKPYLLRTICSAIPCTILGVWGLVRK